ncbi:Uncharacterised protein [Candidatus Venteria ishoeyi]|uniref:Ribbon-helix-helix protein CopG domain-containing protein n=2 Tax=Candidatus Venteria ishoeyi TaxID=1899563 RepID=A0A1H6FAQ7_9GAMM|nr:Uncharacterised protein [Candidatus Venteria ishoeyi]
MHRLSLMIDESLYKKAQDFSAIEKKSIAQIVRESLTDYLDKNDKQVNLLLEAEDEQEVLEILAENNFSSEDEFKKKFGL